MIDIYNAGDITEAELIRGLLGNHGVEAQISGQYLTGALGELPVSGLIRVQVRQQDLEKAKSILNDYEAGEFILPDGQPLLEDEDQRDDDFLIA